MELGAQKHARLVIGDDVFVNQGSSIVAHREIELGDHVRVGDFVAIYDTDHHAVDASQPPRTAATRVLEGAWLSRGVIVMPGVTVGRNAVVAAASVVIKDVPDHTLVAGNPAREVRKLRIPDGWIRD